LNSEEKCYAVTGAFEGKGYVNITGNFDGMGLSFGFIQWNFGMGSLQPLLMTMYENGPVTFKRCCTVEVDGEVKDLSGYLVSVCRDMSNREAVEWVSQRQTNSGGRWRLLPHWQKVFENLGREPGFQAIQRKAAGEYMERARGYVRTLGFRTERALALMFDVCVQNGSIKKSAMDAYRRALAANPGAGERQRLAMVAEAVAEASRPQFVQDVRSRKMCIVNGRGVVHGKSFDLAGAYGLGDGPIV